MKERAYKSIEDYYTKHKFNTEGVTFSVYGDNTYAIKTWLRDAGFRFSPIFGWHIDTEDVELPSGYCLIPVYIYDYMTWDKENHIMVPNEYAKDAVAAYLRSYAGPDPSEYLDGEIGDRLRDIPVTFKSMRGFHGFYGWTHVYTFTQNNNVITWFTTTLPDIEENHCYLLTGTIKKFVEYRGRKTTQLNRVILKEV